MRTMANGRVKRTQAEWREIVEKFEASGLSGAAFCRREKISAGTFSRWRHQSSSVRDDAGSFVELPVPARRHESSLSPGEMELVLPGGVRLRWRP